jgi:prepilin-type N-terminal cleavage/methylation domain-containing protein
MEVSGNVIPERSGLNACRTNLCVRQPMFHGQKCGLVRRVGLSAFTMVEVMFSMAIVGVLIVALYSALASAIPMVRSCQENEHVTQILSEKLDTIRLYNWTQMTNGFVQTNFVVGIEPMLTNSRPYYTGRVSIVEAPIAEVYRSNLLQVTVTVDWVSGSRPQSQSMVTYVAKYGLQTYIMR